ncbi:MAG: hypothetical protein E4H40_03645 [Candidatus Brocadiia bacterium]|nr:MAG: hypothetical protein E4H40_03645 [Candidatus Brocadiia bacterium]
MHGQSDLLLRIFQNVNWVKVIHITVAVASIWALLRFKCWYLKQRLDKERIEQNWHEPVEVTERWRGR